MAPEGTSELGFLRWVKKRTARVDQNLGQTGSPSGPDLSVDSLAEVEDTGPNGETPALVTQAVLCAVEWERGDVVWIGTIAHEATGSVGVKTDHEEECEVVSVPEGLEALCADLVVGSGVHENHDEEHEVSSDTAWLGVMDVEGSLRADL